MSFQLSVLNELNWQSEQNAQFDYTKTYFAFKICHSRVWFEYIKIKVSLNAEKVKNKQKKSHKQIFWPQMCRRIVKPKFKHG
jgi:hypothetical protein